MSLRVGHLASSAILVAEIPTEKLNHLNNFELHFEFENETSFAFLFCLTYYPSLYSNFHLEFSKENLYSFEILD